MMKIMHAEELQLLSEQIPTPAIKFMEQHDIKRKRQLGAFYTPLNVSEVLCEWGIKSSEENILEPCFGGCTFLDASIARLKILGSTRPEETIYGCDIDPLAFEYLKASLGVKEPSSHFSRADFLTLDVNAFPTQGIDAVIGNPPYIRHSDFDSDQKKTIAEWAARYQIKLTGRTSLWTHFVLHSMNFLKVGGRMAWVLPGSFMSAQYAKQIRERLASKFERVLAVTLTERIFLTEGTEETTVILLADGYEGALSRTGIQVACCDSILELKDSIDEWDKNTANLETLDSFNGSVMVPKNVRSLFHALSKSQCVRTLGELAQVQIGIVTGDSKFFIRSRADWESQGITKKHLKYILPRARWVDGIVLRDYDCDQQIENGAPCLLLDTSVKEISLSVSEYLESYPPKKRDSNATFSKRPIWHFPGDAKIPDAFLVFMTHLGPRIVLNVVGANSTNSVYRVYFKENKKQDFLKLIAISMHSTFTQLSAEMVGRGRGSGALKLEPSEALKLHLLLPMEIPSKRIDLVFEEIHALLKIGLTDEVRKVTDKFILEHINAEDAERFSLLESGLEIARQRRMR
jgi:adenine-specific DNA-methyltransferase